MEQRQRRRAWLGTVVAIVLSVLFATAQAAFAIQIDKPVPNGGQITACTDGNPNVTLSNSGTYCKASGGPTPYTWSLTPPAAGTVQNVLSNGTIARFIAHKAWAESTNYAQQFTLTVTDASGASASTQIYPITLIWVELGTFAPLTGSKDRVVHHKDSWNQIERTREVGLECRGTVSIFKVFTHAYAVTGGPGGQTGAGRIDVREFDGDPTAVQQSGCTPPPGVTAPFGKWKLVPQGGVTSSWNASPPPNTPKGTVHTLTVRGDVTSSFQDDIEWDVGIETGPSLHNCADGIGCVMKYTVVKVDVTCDSLSDSQEKQPGRYLAYEKGESPGDSEATVTMKRVLPDDFSGYQLRLETVDDQELPSTAVIQIVGGGQSLDKNANGELAHSPTIEAAGKSSIAWDSRARVHLRANGTEVGDETCRDWVAFTVIEYDIVNPVKESGGAITTPATSASANGNEFAFSTASPGTLSIEWRMKVLPDTGQVRIDLEGGMTLAIDSVGNAATWANGQSLVYDTNDARWEETASYSGLPSNSSDFGLKHYDLTIRGPNVSSPIATPRRDIEVFFPSADGDTNHPGAGSGTTPNWYFYWMQTSAASGHSSAFQYDAAGTQNGGLAWTDQITVYPTAPNLTCHLSYKNNDSYSVQNKYEFDNAGSTLTGIDAFAWAVIHEYKHKTTDEGYWPSGWVSAQDTDVDLLPDASEAGILAAGEYQVNATAGNPSGGPFSGSSTDTDGDGLGNGDEEDWVCFKQKRDSHWTIGSADDEDWSQGGHKWQQ